MTLTLAIVGAATGVVGMLLDLSRSMFDRPRLHVQTNVTSSIAEPAVVGIDVTNRGRRPTTILKTAFKADSEAQIRDPDSGAVVGTGAIEITLSQEPTVIAAHGGVQQFRGVLGDWPGPFFADEPLRAYVIDSYKNRPTWGPAGPILRSLVRSGWNPPGASPEMLAPFAEPVRPQPVEPRWKLWRPKEDRKPLWTRRRRSQSDGNK